MKQERGPVLSIMRAVLEQLEADSDPESRRLGSRIETVVNQIGMHYFWCNQTEQKWVDTVLLFIADCEKDRLKEPKSIGDVAVYKTLAVVYRAVSNAIERLEAMYRYLDAIEKMGEDQITRINDEVEKALISADIDAAFESILKKTGPLVLVDRQNATSYEVN